MIVTMRSDDLPADDRFAWWSEQLTRDTAPCVVSSSRTGDFRAVLTLAELGPVRLSVHSFPEVRAVRTAALIRRSDPERYWLGLIMANALWFAQGAATPGWTQATCCSTTPPSPLTPGRCPAPVPGRC